MGLASARPIDVQTSSLVNQLKVHIYICAYKNDFNGCTLALQEQKNPRAELMTELR